LDLATKTKLGKLRKFLFEQRGRVLEALQRLGPSLAASQGGAIPCLPVESVFDLKVENEKLASKMRPLSMEDTQRCADTAQAGFSQWSQTAGLHSVNQRMLQRLKDSLSAGFAQRECPAQLACRIRAIFNQQAASIGPETFTLPQAQATGAPNQRQQNE
jgi:hypothetical protein